jgi:hypothetical protein
MMMTNGLRTKIEDPCLVHVKTPTTHMKKNLPAINLCLDLEVVGKLLAVLFPGHKDEDGALGHKLHQVLHQPLPLGPTQWQHLQ